MKFALHTISYAGLWPGQQLLSIEAIINKAADLGYDGIELMAKRPHGSLLDLDSERRAKIKALLKERKIECACIGGYTNFTLQYQDTMLPQLEMQIDNVTRLAELASDLDCPIVRIFTGYEQPDVPYMQQWAMIVKSIKECCQRAAKYNVSIGIQNHHDLGVDGRSLSQMIDEIGEPNCIPLYDAWSPAVQNLDFADGLKYFKDPLTYTTVADYIKLPRFNYNPDLVNYDRGLDRVQAVPMGEGIIEYKKFFAEMKEQGFDGWVCYEMCSPLLGGGSEQNLDNCAKQFLQYMRKL